MSRCGQTEALLEVAFEDRDLSRAQAAHVGSCVVCARALAEVRLFERELSRVGSAVTEEPLPAVHDLMDAVAPGWEGRSMISRRSLVAGSGIALALALVVFAGGTWLSNQFSGRITPGAMPPEVVDAWVGASRATAVAETRLGPRDPSVWEAVQVELCGNTAIAFYADRNRGAAYVWAIGRPGEPASGLLDTGTATRIEDPEVARMRALLPICDLAYSDPEAPAVVLRALPVEPQSVAIVPSFLWTGAAEDAPVLVEPQDDRDVSLRLSAFLQGTVDDPSIAAVDIFTEAERLRYSVSIPGFAVETDLEGERLRFEFRDSKGNVVAAGPVEVLGRGDARRAVEFAARAEVLAEDERRALEFNRPGIDCSSWQDLRHLERLTVAAVVLLDLERVRTIQELPPGVSPAEIVASAEVSIGKACQGSPDDRTVAEVARALYGRD